MYKTMASNPGVSPTNLTPTTSGLIGGLIGVVVGIVGTMTVLGRVQVEEGRKPGVFFSEYLLMEYDEDVDKNST
jgi:uncharacterized membrane protein